MQNHNGRSDWGVKKMPLTEAQKRRKAKYDGKILKRVMIEFYPQDADLLQKVMEQESKQAYIKDLIRKDLK